MEEKNFAGAIGLSPDDLTSIWSACMTCAAALAKNTDDAEDVKESLHLMHIAARIEQMLEKSVVKCPKAMKENGTEN